MAEKINKYGPQSPQTLQSLKTPVKQIVIGPSHLGLLLEDGRALRVAFTVITERLDLSKAEPSKGYVHANIQQILLKSFVHVLILVFVSIWLFVDAEMAAAVVAMHRQVMHHRVRNKHRVRHDSWHDHVLV